MLNATPVQRGREACRLSEEDKVLAAVLAPHSHSFCFDVSNIAAEAYAKSVWFGFLADGDGHQGTRDASEFLGVLSLLLFSRRTGRQTYYRINFIPTRHHRRPSPIPTSLRSPSLPLHSSTISFDPSVPYRPSDSIRPKQSKSQPQQCGRTRGKTAERSNSSYSWQRRREERAARVKFLISASGQPGKEAGREERKSASIIADL